MGSEKKRQRWHSRRLIAYLWWCGDYICDCTQPKVEEIRPNLDAGYPWVCRTVLWEGIFLSGGSELEEYAAQRIELEVAAMEYNIPLGEDHCGERQVVLDLALP